MVWQTNFKEDDMDRFIRRNAVRYGCLVFLALLVAQFEGIAQKVGAQKYERVTIPNTELRSIHSRIVDQEFTIYVQLPPDYAADTAATYPVLYVTDANRCFPMAANISGVLSFPKGNFPQIIVVGIGYPIRNMADWAAWRTRDLTPASDTATDNYWNRQLFGAVGRKYDVRSGGASRFLEFIMQELIPFMESNYRVSRSDRGLAGYSYGGLFALYALFTHPEIFHRYFAGSPSVEFGNNMIFRLAGDTAATGRGVQPKIFLSAGSLEDSSTVAGVKSMSALLQSRYSPDGQVALQIFDGENHRSCMAAAIMRAFRTLYGR
jgi:uncharacterized protein